MRAFSDVHLVVRFGPVSGAGIALLFVLGCGGGGGEKAQSLGRGEVSGVVFDADHQPVRGATVYVDTGGTRETVTDSLGSYVLTGVIADDVVIGARTADGTYLGQNLARVYKGERDVSVNITLYPAGSLGRVYGKVTDGQGRALRGLRVFARPTDGDVLSSASAVTDGNGFYSIGRLARNVEYRLLANNLGRGEATTPITLTGSETRQDLALTGESNPTLSPPEALEAIAYTTPGEDTLSRSVDSSAQRKALESVKRLLDPTRAARLAKLAKTRNTTTYDEPIEIDLSWNEYTTIDTYGFGIYRFVGTGTTPIETFLHDPLANYFADGDATIRDGVSYTYRITAINSSYDENTGAGESEYSNSSTVVPLGELLLNPPVNGAARWQSVGGADLYQVYSYAQYPGLAVAPIEKSAELSAGTTAYTLPAGTRYYVVVASRADGSAQALSPVASVN